MEPRQRRACKLPAVCKFVDLWTQYIHAVKTPNAAFMGDTAKKTAGGPSALITPGPQLTGDDTADPVVQTLCVEGLGCFRYGVQLYLTRRFQAVIGADVGRFIGVGFGLDLLCLRFRRRDVVVFAQVYIPVYRRRILRLDDVGVSNNRTLFRISK